VYWALQYGTKEIWEIIPKTKVPAGRNIIGARWILARKDNECYQVRFIAKGLSQIQRKDFQENHVPVILDTTLHLLVDIKTVLQLEAEQFDIETAFFYGKFEEDLWIVIPDGYQDYVRERLNEDIHPKTHYLQLTKAIYGLVQEARQLWNKLKDVVSCIGYLLSQANSCLF
jgi:hypothetical protein